MKRIEITCIDCGLTRWSNGRHERCNPCATKLKYEAVRTARFELLKSMYTDVSRAEITSYGKTAWKFTHAQCGTEQIWTDSNLTKQLDIHPTITPCKKCGAKRRTKEATRVSALNNGAPDHLLPAWEAYRRTVRKLSEQTYRKYKLEINPLNLKRSLGTDGFHLDHKHSIIEGFEKGIAPEVLADKSNLQMLPGIENISKGRKSVI